MTDTPIEKQELFLDDEKLEALWKRHSGANLKNIQKSAYLTIENVPCSNSSRFIPMFKTQQITENNFRPRCISLPTANPRDSFVRVMNPQTFSGSIQRKIFMDDGWPDFNALKLKANSPRGKIRVSKKGNSGNVKSSHQDYNNTGRSQILLSENKPEFLQSTSTALSFSSKPYIPNSIYPTPSPSPPG